MKIGTFKGIFIYCVISIAACIHVTDKSSKTVFQKHSPGSKEYKNELASNLRHNSENLTYTFLKYFKINKQEYISIKVEGSDFAATSQVIVNDWGKLKHLRRTRGLGYSGAELRGLKLNIAESPSGADLIFDDLEKIID